MKYIFILILTILIASCDDFLEERSQDLIQPKTVSEYKEILLGEAYNSDTDPTPYLDIMTDDIQERNDLGRPYWSDTKKEVYGFYTWQKDAEQTIDGIRYNDIAWTVFYHKILTANLAIEKSKSVEGLEGSIEDLNDLLGECYFLRAYSYFMLANLYGPTYNPITADKDLCVPINNNTNIEDKVFKRATVIDVYKLINDDIKQSVEYFEKSDIKKNKFRINKEAACLIASRIFLYQNKFKDAFNYASKVINSKPELCNLNNYTESYFISDKNPEIILSCGKYDIDIYDYNAKATFCVSDELLTLYSDNDLRKSKFFKTKRSVLYPNKVYSKSTIYDLCLRTAEAYLNRAEALCGLKNYDDAMKDIKELRSNRFSGEHNVSASNQEECLNIIKQERRRELCFEYQRWFDLRRWDRPQITHHYSVMGDESTKKTYVLEKDDDAYTLQIPKSVSEINNAIVKNKRNDRPSK